MSAIFRKELKSYFTGPIAYVFMAVLLVTTGIYTMIYNLSYQYATYEYVYGAVSFIYLIIIPILTMRIFAEERKQKTEQLLYCLPLKMSSIVAGKYLAAVTVLAVPCAITGIYPFILSLYGNVNFKIVFVSLLAFFLLGAALIAVCMFISSLTENQILAAIISFIVVFIKYFIANLSGFVSGSSFASCLCLMAVIVALALIVNYLTKNKLLAEIVAIVLLAALLAVFLIDPSLLEGVAPEILNRLALFDGFYNMVYGLFDLGTVVMFLSVVVLFNHMSVVSLEKRRWA